MWKGQAILFPFAYDADKSGNILALIFKLRLMTICMFFMLRSIIKCISTNKLNLFLLSISSKCCAYQSTVSHCKKLLL